MEDTKGSTEGSCFLCAPRPEWVWAESDNFFAMAALGPVVEGMSIVATREHVRSMFDITDALVSELVEFTEAACSRIEATYGVPVHITEHGRVGLCEVVGDSYDEHCHHAHRLLFPTGASLATTLNQSEIAPLVASAFSEARSKGSHLTEYLYYEGPDGQIAVGTNDESTPRQFFRGVVADAIGQPHLRSWRERPRPELVDAAAARLSP